MDEGGFGVPPKLGKVNMDGSMPSILVKISEQPVALTIDLINKKLYYSTRYQSFVSNFSFFFISFASLITDWLTPLLYKSINYKACGRTFVFLCRDVSFCVMNFLRSKQKKNLFAACLGTDTDFIAIDKVHFYLWNKERLTN